MCPRCGEKKSVKSFWKSRDRKDGFQVYCIACLLAQRLREGYKKYRKQYYRKNKSYFSNYHFKARYNVTLDERNRMIKERENRCDICECMYQSEYLQIDHNHLTGQVRGILCAACNKALGFAEKRWNKIKEYLEVAHGNKRYQRCSKRNQG